MGGEISLCACDEPSTRPDAPKAREPRAQGQGPHPQHRRERRFTEVGLASAEVSPKDLAAKQRYEAQRFQTTGLTRNAPPPQPDPLERADSPEPLEACSVSPRKHPQCALGDTLSSQQVDATAEVCGIGVQFRTDRNGSMVVQSLIEGGPADLSHAVFEGDILFMVDGKVLVRKPLNEVMDSVLGPKGSRVRVVFLRHGKEVGVNLTRMPGFKIGGVQSSPPVLAAKVDLTAGRAAGKKSEHTRYAHSRDSTEQAFNNTVGLCTLDRGGDRVAGADLRGDTERSGC